jgi:type IV secretion system protein VirD4
MTGFTLPRGIGNNHGRPLATAEWATPEDIARFAFEQACKSDGMDAIRVGFTPHVELAGILETIYAEAAKAWDDAGRLPNKDARARMALQTMVSEKFRAVCEAASMPVSISDDRHILTFAGTRAGKGTTSITPNLCFYKGSVVVLDPKGENASLAALRRGGGDPEWCEGLGQTVFVFDPYGVSEHAVSNTVNASFNPLESLDPQSPTFVEDVVALADALIVPSKDDNGEHFDEMARRFIAAVIFYCFAYPQLDGDKKPCVPSLVDVRAYLMRGDEDAAEAERHGIKQVEELTGEAIDGKSIDPIRAMFRAMILKPDFAGGAMANDAGALMQAGDREFGAIVTTSSRATAFVDSPLMKRVLQSSNFDPQSVKTDPKGVSVFICLPPKYQATAAPWMRVLLTSILRACQDELTPPANGAPVLFVLDELAVLGRMRLIEQAIPFAAGYGVTLWPIFQDVAQLERIYGDNAQSFIANAGVIELFAVFDTKTAELCSKLLGEVELSRLTASQNLTQTGSTGAPSDYDRQTRPFTGGGGLGALVRTAAALTADDRTHQEGYSASTTSAEALHTVPLLRADEVRRLTARDTGLKIVIPNGGLPMVLRRIEYFKDPRLVGRYVPLKTRRAGVQNFQSPTDLRQYDKPEAAAERANAAYAELAIPLRLISNMKPKTA